MGLLDRMDGFAPLRNGLQRIAEKMGQWAGIPMPLEGETLVVEPTYPQAKELMAMCGGAEKPADIDDGDPELTGARVRNTFWSSHKQSDVVVIEKADGRVVYGIRPGVNHFGFDLRTLGCSEAWGIEQESKALNLLGSLVTHRQFKQYLLTGMFVEASKRSGVTYVFRRLKPTVALHVVAGQVKVLCALCLHPVSFYQGSWAGGLCPSDDVVSHLMLARGDERLFWARANQHPAWRAEAGL